MEDFSKRLDYIIRVLAGGKSTEFAKLLGVSPSAITRFKERGEIPEKHLAFLEYLGINTNWLLKNEGNPFHPKPNAKEISFNIQETIDIVKRILSIRKIKIPANAGFGYTFQEIEEEQVIYQPVESKLNPKEWMIFTVSGDSMIPDIPENSTVFVHTTEEPKNGKVIVCTLNGILYCKIYQVVDGQIYLMSSNAKYEPIKVSEYDDFRIIGVVRKIEKNL